MMTPKSKKIDIIKWSITFLLFSAVLLTPPISNITDYQAHNKTEDNFESLIKTSNFLKPKGIRLTNVNDSKNSMLVTWYTENEASDPKLIYSTKSTLINNRTIIPTSQLNEETYLYRAIMKELESNTTYFYQISSDPSTKREILNFTTTDMLQAKSFKFLVFGDSRTQREPRREIINAIIENFDDIKFFIHTGDIVSDGRNQTQWNDYFDDVENLTRFIPGYFIEGNHEHLEGYMYDNLYLPSNGLNSYYYSFDIGPLSFFGLNTQRDHPIQTTWLEEALNNSHKNNDIIWKIAFMHEPIFNSMSTRSDRFDLIASWCPLFEQYNVDFVFAGHNHYYERSYPMNKFKEFDNNTNYNFKNLSNPIYFLTGGAGAPLHTRDTNPNYTAHYNSSYNFIIVDIKYNKSKEEVTLSLETWIVPNDYSGIYLIDNITVVKNYTFDPVINGDDKIIGPTIGFVIILLMSVTSLIYIEIKRGKIR